MLNDSTDNRLPERLNILIFTYLNFNLVLSIACPMSLLSWNNIVLQVSFIVQLLRRIIDKYSLIIKCLSFTRFCNCSFAASFRVRRPNSVLIGSVASAQHSSSRDQQWPRRYIGSSRPHLVLFCSSAVLDPRVGHTMNVLSPYLSLSSVILTNSSTESPVHVLMLSIQAVRGLPRLRAPGIAPCIISFSRQLLCAVRPVNFIGKHSCSFNDSTRVCVCV